MSVEHSCKERQEAFQTVAQTQPGSVPYVNQRPIHVRKRFEGQSLGDFLSAFSHYRDAPLRLEQEFQAGLIQVDGKKARLNQLLVAGNIVGVTEENTVEPEINPDLQVLFEDEAILVVHKPSPLPVHPCGRFNKNSLTSLAKLAWPDLHLRVVHRLDANTTGVMVFAKTQAASQALHIAFAAQKVDKAYSVRVHGRPAEVRFEVDAAIEKDASFAGTRELSEEGRAAKTLFEVEQELDDGTTLLVARPKTGRTNQIRLHLHSLGLPIVGDPAYGEKRSLDLGLTSKSLLFLHARSLSFQHPVHEQQVCFTKAHPSWFEQLM
jgi:UPF0176 protein